MDVSRARLILGTEADVALHAAGPLLPVALPHQPGRALTLTGRFLAAIAALYGSWCLCVSAGPWLSGDEPLSELARHFVGSGPASTVLGVTIGCELLHSLEEADPVLSRSAATVPGRGHRGS